jgi:hypothetical protein
MRSFLQLLQTHMHIYIYKIYLELLYTFASHWLVLQSTVFDSQWHVVFQVSKILVTETIFSGKCRQNYVQNCSSIKLRINKFHKSKMLVDILCRPVLNFMFTQVSFLPVTFLLKYFSVWYLITLNMYTQMHVGLQVQCHLFLSYFNQNWHTLIHFIAPSTKFNKTSLVVCHLCHSKRQTKMLKDVPISKE